MLQMIGALLPTGLVAAALWWLAKRAKRNPPRVVVHFASWVLCAFLWMLGSVGLGPSAFQSFLAGLWLYALPQLFWYVAERLRRGRVSATKSPLIQPLDQPLPQTLPLLRSWAVGLHGGQLVLLLLFALPLGVVAAGAGAIAASSAHDALKSLEDNEYREAPQFVDLAGTTFRMTEKLEPAYLARLRVITDSLLRSGETTYAIESQIRDAKIPLEVAYVSSRADLDSRAIARLWAWPVLGVGLGLVVFALWALWRWLGARARVPRAPKQ